MIQGDLFAPRPSVTIIEGIPDDVTYYFERLALEVAGRGFKRYSSDAILHRIRWHEQIERGNREFKCNNDWTAKLSRWFMSEHPEHDGFFETRRSSHCIDKTTEFNEATA